MDRMLFIRPTVKTLIGMVDDDGVSFLSFLSGRVAKPKVNLPGGGIDPDESAAEALQRELEEECGLYYPLSALRAMPVLIDRVTPSSRQNWRKKRLIVGYLTVPSSVKIKLDNKELIAPVVHRTIADFQVRLQTSPGTRREAATAYLEAAYNWLALQLQ